MCAVVPGLSARGRFNSNNTPTISNPDNLEQCVGFRNLQLAGYAKKRKEDDHRTASCSKPERSGDAKEVANKRRTEHSSAPKPGLSEYGKVRYPSLECITIKDFSIPRSPQKP